MKKLYKKGTKSAKSKDGMYAMTSRTFSGASGSSLVSGYTMGPSVKKASKKLKAKNKKP